MRTRSTVRVPALVFLALFAVYAATACRTVGAGDSGELTAALSTWGVAHAPGYPLFSLVGNLVSHAVHFSEPAFVLNLMNACFAALACAVLAAATATITGREMAGLVAGLALGSSRVFWLQALALEVFSFNALMAAVLLYLLCRFLVSADKPGTALWSVPVAVLVTTTMVTHHLTLALLALPIALAYAAELSSEVRSGLSAPVLRRVAVRSVIAAAAGLLMILYIPIAAHSDPPLNWGDARDLSSLLRLLTRRDFGGGTLMSPGIVVNQVLMNGEAASPLGQRHYLAFWTQLPRDFGWAFPALIALGWVWVARHSRPLLIMAASFFVLLTLFFARINTPILPVFDNVTQAFFILPHVVLAFFAGCGVALLITAVERVRLAPLAVGGLLIACTTLPMLILNWPIVDQRTNTFVDDLGRNLLAGMPDRSILLNTGELFACSLQYEQYCRGNRRDVTVVDQDLLAMSWYAKQLNRRGIVDTPDEAHGRVTSTALSSAAWMDRYVGGGAGTRARPIVAVTLLDGSYAASYRLQELGIWSIALPRSRPVDLIPWERQYSDVVKQWRLQSLDRPYPEASWEAHERVFYDYALGQLEGVRDLVEAYSSTHAPFARVPALEHAQNWAGPRRADLLGFRADFLRECLSDNLLPGNTDAEARVAAQAMSLARASLAIDAENVQALHAMASLMAFRPEFSDSRAEIKTRERLVEQRPGDFGELIPYFRLALRCMRDPACRDPAIERGAEAAQQRLIRLLAICAKLAPESKLAELQTHWSQPLESIAEIR